MSTTLQNSLSKLPDAPGVYFFYDSQKVVLYIGKATSLRDRVRSYLRSDLSTVRGPLLVQMVEKAVRVSFQQTDSVLEALILEVNLIKKYRPVYNTKEKDDKSFNYVVLTDEDFPRILLVRGRELHAQANTNDRALYSQVFGPFPHGAQLKEALKIIRKIFPYRDKCTPCKKHTGPSCMEKKCKPCFNKHLGLCPGVCSGEISKTDYRKIVQRIALLFAGKKQELVRGLERDMKSSAKAEKFEAAATLRGQMFALRHIQDVSLIKNDDKNYQREFLLGKSGGKSMRIEAYDVAHLGGDATVGVMVVVVDGEAEKGQYRKFRIREAKAGDDTGALAEILLRRLEHTEWPLPRLIVVDGGTAQMNVAKRILLTAGVYITVVGVVKDEHHRPREIRYLERKRINISDEKDILLANAEAHRFAIAYHRKKLQKKLLQE